MINQVGVQSEAFNVQLESAFQLKNLILRSYYIFSIFSLLLIFYLLRGPEKNLGLFILLHFKRHCKIVTLENLLVKNLAGARGHGCGCP